MKLNEIESVKGNGLELKIEGQNLKINGNIELEDPSELLSPFFNSLHNTILEEKLNKIVVDIKELSYLNSSGIRELVGWIMKLDELPDEKKYSIHFLCCYKNHWQETSISTLEFLNPNYITKEFS